MNENRSTAEDWLQALLSRGATKETVATYRFNLECYLGWLASHRKRLSDVLMTDVSSYMGHLDEKGYSENTITVRRAVLRTLHNYLYRAGRSKFNPDIQMDQARRKRMLPVIMSVQDVETFLETAHSLACDGSVGLYRQAAYARRAALFETLYASGMTITEAITLPATVLNSKERLLEVKGRRGKKRLVPLGKRALEAIDLWRDLAEELGVASSTWLFHSVRNGWKHTNRSAAYRDIQETAEISGIARPRDVTPHVLRHAFATHLLENGADLRSIQILMGHATLQTTEIYTHVEVSHLQRTVFEMHPLADVIES